MGKHLQRGTLVPVDLNSLVAVASIQRHLPPPEKREAFGPVLEIRAGTVLALRVPDEPTRYRIFEVVDNLIHPFAAYDPTTPIRVRHFDVIDGPHGEAFDIRHQETLSILSLANVAQLQYKTTPDRFLYVLRTPIITEWDVDSVEVTATFPTKTLAGPGSLSFRDGDASATVQSREQSLFVDEVLPVDVSTVYAKLTDGVIVPTSLTPPSWSASQVMCRGASLGDPDALFRFRVSNLNLAFTDGEITATRETIRGLTLNGFSNRIIPEFPTGINLLTAHDAYVVTIFEREARIVQSARNHVSVIHEGAPFEPDALNDVINLLQYLCGNRGQHLSTETFSDAGRLDFRYQERNTPTSRGLAPVRIDSRTSTPALIAQQFPEMLTGIRQLREKTPVKLDAAFHHYFEGVNSSYPVTRILMLAVAIDTLVALEIGNQKQVHIIPNSAFQRVLDPIRNATRAALQSEGIEDPFLTQMMNKLNGLNNASARQRQNDFWKELGIELTVEESRVLETRHEVVHEGHVGSELTSESLWDNYRRSNILANLFNRAMLTLIGWKGSYLDALDDGKRSEIPLLPPETEKGRQPPPA